MKTKLLKKVRRKYRIIRNGLGEEFLQEKNLFEWDSVNVYTRTIVENLYSYSDIMGEFRAILDYRYSRYTRKSKIKKQKRKQLTKVWYNANS